MNRLASETSPYLLQHAGNPVDWYPWSTEAFDTASRLDRPVMLSIGYSSCHWCHVMAHESFEDEVTASRLNDRFVSVKVDREERPDVDAVYMDAVQALSGRGGWPMTVFLTPDRRPFFAGTYYPARDMAGTPSFRRVLDAVDEAWRERRDEVEKQADDLLGAVARRSQVSTELLHSLETRPGGSETALAASLSELSARFDPAWGGFSPAPKFPSATLVELCLEHHRLSGEDLSLQMATRTLDAMAAGGLYDHLGGGFHRYATDTTWTVPHFEKMLYDQAQLLRAYLHAWQLTKERKWLEVVSETVGYVLGDLAATSGGGLCSSEDADSEGEEGLFYTWTPHEISEVSGDGAAELCEWYQVTRAGNFEGRSILRRPLRATAVRPETVEEARLALLRARSRRVRPARDDKVLTEWNAMFAAALAEAAAATGREDWGRAAEDVGDFLLAELRRPDGRWLRSWKDGETRHLAYAADYAWVVELFTRLSELTGRAAWLERAVETAASMLELFARGDVLLYTTGEDAEQLVVRQVELEDSATPSATSVAAAALLRLGALTGDTAMSERGEVMVSSLLELAGGQPLAVANAVAANDLVASGITEVVVGGRQRDLLEVCRRRYEPTQVIAWGEPTTSPLWEGRDHDRPLAYVCRRYVCQSPSASPGDLVERLDSVLDEQRSRYAEGSRA